MSRDIEWTKSPQINDLELSILTGTVSAQHNYSKMTNGWWLWHGPESYLQNYIARVVARKTGHAVYVDASLKKIRREIERGPGRPAENGSKRPDLSVWLKSSDEVRAAIEIKRAASVRMLKRDATKLQKWLGQADAPRSAYLLAYSEAKGAKRHDRLRRRWKDWADELGWACVGSVIDPQGDGDYSWGACLLRRDRPK